MSVASASDVRALFASVSAAALLVAATDARGQGNPRSAPIGGRTALMGGAGIALGRDGASPFLNPATITRIEDTGLALSGVFYTLQQTHLSGFHQPRPGPVQLPDTDLARGRIDAIPSTVCLFASVGKWKEHEAEGGEHRRGRQKVAACVGHISTLRYDASAVSYVGAAGGLQSNQNISITHRWNRLFVGPTYAYYVTDRLSLGVSLFGIATTVASTWSVDATVSDVSGRARASGYDTAYNAYSIDFASVLGMVYHLDAHHVVGLTMSTPSVHVLDHYRANASIRQSGPTAFSTLSSATGDFASPPPVRAGAGLGAEIGRLRIEVDASVWIPLTYFARIPMHVDQATVANGAITRSSFDTTERTSAGTIVDSAVGAEVFLRHAKLSLLGGVATDFSALAPLSASPPPNTIGESRTQRVAASLGVGMYGKGTELLFGTELSYAKGESVAVDAFAEPPRLAVVNERSYGAMLIIAGRTSFTSLGRTFRELWGSP